MDKLHTVESKIHANHITDIVLEFTWEILTTKKVVTMTKSGLLWRMEIPASKANKKSSKNKQELAGDQ